MMTAGKSKQEIRKQLRSGREGIPEQTFFHNSEIITDILQQQEEYAKARTIHCYVSMNERREVDTHPLIKKIIESGKKLVVPVTQFEDQSLEHLSLEAFDDLETNKWGVLEPRKGEKYQPAEMDLVIVPMVGGDEQAHRIGYGGGFYDRFLSHVSCPTIGLCFEQNIVPSLPTEAFDVPLDKIITEERVVHRKDRSEG